MSFPFDLRSYPARLVLGVFTLILLTTLSAGVPAYWLTRAELERQAWSHVVGAEQATYSLLAAEQDRLDGLLTLFTERPTLRRLLREPRRAELAAYLSAFQEQSELGLLTLCQPSPPRTAQQWQPVLLVHARSKASTDSTFMPRAQRC
jgi:hypothetical protein